METYQNEVIDPGDRASRFAHSVNINSYGNCPALRVVAHEADNFRGPVGFLWRPEILQRLASYKLDITGKITDWDTLEEVENDGAGGKTQFCTLLGEQESFARLGWEIITMTADDFARSGRLPCLIDNELQVKRITEENFHLVEALFSGYGQALKQANLVNITGETAVMKHSITAFCDLNDDRQLVMTWGASCLGLASKKLLLNPNNIKPGMLVVGFSEPGYRCNGGTFFTNLIMAKYGSDIRAIMNNPEAMDFVRKLTVPSQSYAKTVARLVGWKTNGDVGEPLADIKGIAHITGGGVWHKFGELLPRGVGAYLDNMPELAEVLLQAQEMSQDTALALTDFNAYGTIHGGCGMLLVVQDMDSALRIVKEAKADGIKAQLVGSTNDSDELVIVSRFSKRGAQLAIELR